MVMLEVDSDISSCGATCREPVVAVQLTFRPQRDQGKIADMQTFPTADWAFSMIRQVLLRRYRTSLWLRCPTYAPKSALNTALDLV